MKVQQQLEQDLQALAPTYLYIENESAGHGGYFPGKESHFKVTIVSPIFQGLRAVQRHQKVYAVANPLLASKTIHALAIHAYAPDEWQGQNPESPACVHGLKTV